MAAARLPTRIRFIVVVRLQMTRAAIKIRLYAGSMIGTASRANRRSENRGEKLSAVRGEDGVIGENHILPRLAAAGTAARNGQKPQAAVPAAAKQNISTKFNKSVLFFRSIVVAFRIREKASSFYP